MDQKFRSHRRYLLGVAYRMLGSVTDAEDMVQESWLRWYKQSRSGVDIENTRAYLTRIVTNLSIDLLRKRKTERGNYTGPWLPEPLLDEMFVEDAGQQKIQSLETLSIAFMFLLERLSPKERAVFILKEALDYQHDEIADLLDLSAANSRQLLRRAREKTNTETGLYQVDKEKHKVLLSSFMEALWNGDTEKLQQVLASDAIAYTDGGGVVSAARIPLQGFDRITQVFLHLGKKYTEQQLRVQWVRVNADWCAALLVNDEVVSVITITVHDDLIGEIYVMRNPQKLSQLKQYTENL